MEPLAAVTRNNYIESVHYGLVCIVDSTGKILYKLGDPNTKIYFRSSAKPIQVIPLIQSGAYKELGLSKKEIAIACASHSGQKIHQSTAGEILNKLDLLYTDLHCGTMLPYNEEEQKRLLAENVAPSVFHCSCSGKHAAMLALSKYRGLSIKDYENITHPIQQEILKTISEFTGEALNTITTGIDGCGLPIYLLPIYSIALSYARLVNYAQDTTHPYSDSCNLVFDAMNQYPEMVAGDFEFCTELMRVTNGKLIAKVGSEAVYCIGIKNNNLGICVKISDGNERAVYPIVIQLLRELRIIDENEFSRLKHWHKPILKNNLGDKIGEISTIFDLKKTNHRKDILGRKLEEIIPPDYS